MTYTISPLSEEILQVPPGDAKFQHDDVSLLGRYICIVRREAAICGEGLILRKSEAAALLTRRGYAITPLD